MTTKKGLDEVPSEGEALRLLEERKRVHIPDESKRVIPPQKRKGRRRRKRKRKRRRKRGRGRGSLLLPKPRVPRRGLLWILLGLPYRSKLDQ